MAISRKKSASNSVKKTPQPKVKKTENLLEKQMLVDLEKRISMNVGSFLILTEEGDPTQIALAHQKAKSEFLKFGPEMHRIADRIGGPLSYVVADFLESIDIVLHSPEFLDEEIISKCFSTTQRLQQELKS